MDDQVLDDSKINFILDNSRVEQLLEEVARGFEQSPRELILTLLVITLVVFLPLVILLLRRALIRGRRARRGRQLFKERLEKKQLPPVYADLIRIMITRCRIDPARLPLLLSDGAFFSRYAHKMVAKKLASYTRMALLRHHLGLPWRTPPVFVHSTAEFVKGMPLRLTFEKSGQCRVLLEAVEERGLVVPVELKPETGEGVLLEFARQAGYYRGNSRVVAVGTDSIILAHGEGIERVQKRRFFRKRVKLPVALKPEGVADLLPATLMDLSGGGMKVRLEKPVIKPEQLVEVVFHPRESRALRVMGKVLRSSPRQGTCSIVFQIKREGERDRIIRMMQRWS